MSPQAQGARGDSMSNSAASSNSVIQNTRFLLVDSEGASLDKIERYLLMDAAAKVYVAKTPLLALRILQDPRTPVDCVICANKTGTISGIEFLKNLRVGRWGGRSLQHIRFVLLMASRSEWAIDTAIDFRVDGFIYGELDRESFTKAITKALTSEPCKVAHIQGNGADFVIVPFDRAFGKLSFEAQQQAVEAVRDSASRSLRGDVIAVWPEAGGTMGFLAPPRHHPFFQTMTLDFVAANLNRELFLNPEHELELLTVDLAAKDRGETQPAKALRRQIAAREPGDDPGHAKRPFAKADVLKVMAAFKQLGPERFVKAFVREQFVISKLNGGPVKPEMSEFFVSVQDLRKPLFRDAEMHGCGRLFDDLTLLFDQILLRSFKSLPDPERPFSINLNIQSVFTKLFDTFIAEAPVELLTIEFRQPNIIEYSAAFELARGLIQSKGAKIAIDQIYPDTLGAMKFDDLGATMVKINWIKGAKATLHEHARDMKNILDRGIVVVLSRVDDSRALDIGAELGVQRYQGFLIDEMMRVA